MAINIVGTIKKIPPIAWVAIGGIGLVLGWAYLKGNSSASTAPGPADMTTASGGGGSYAVNLGTVGANPVTPIASAATGGLVSGPILAGGSGTTVNAPPGTAVPLAANSQLPPSIAQVAQQVVNAVVPPSSTVNVGGNVVGQLSPWQAGYALQQSQISSQAWQQANASAVAAAMAKFLPAEHAELAAEGKPAGTGYGTSAVGGLDQEEQIALANKVGAGILVPAGAFGPVAGTPTPGLTIAGS